MANYWERLSEAMAHAGVSLKTLQDHLGVSYQAIKKVADGKTKSLTAENNAEAARFLGVNSYWLATGKEAMSQSERYDAGTYCLTERLHAKEAQPSYRAAHVWPFDSIAPAEYDCLSERQKGVVEGYIKRLVEEAGSDLKKNGTY